MEKNGERGGKKRKGDAPQGSSVTSEKRCRIVSSRELLWGVMGHESWGVNTPSNANGTKQLPPALNSLLLGSWANIFESTLKRVRKYSSFQATHRIMYQHDQYHFFVLEPVHFVGRHTQILQINPHFKSRVRKVVVTVPSSWTRV